MNPKTILCYGDSNTWGYIPNADHTAQKARYTLDKRWPGLLQKLLGEKYYVVEEGLNSRTTNLDYEVPPDRNGKTYLPPCLYSHAPIDLVILALGGNDLKTYFNRTPEDIKNGLGDLIEIIQSSTYGPAISQAPKVLITTPVIPLLKVEKYVDERNLEFLKGSIEKAQKLVKQYEVLAKEKECFYLDLSHHVFPSDIDGIHYDETGHMICAKMIANKIKEII